MKPILLLLALFATVHAQADFAHFPKPIRRIFKRKFMVARKVFHHGLLPPTGTSQDHLKAAMKQQKIQKTVETTMGFPCDISLGRRSSEVPESVDRVRPGDIDVIGALGDSLTAGFGAAAIGPFQVFKENRGLSAFIGGQGTWRQYLTLPNILKKFNPNLIGFSLSDALSFEWSAQFNVAEGGAMTHDMPFMAKELIARIRNDSRVDVNNNWKLVTVMIGANDHCADMCYYNIDKYINRRRQLLIKTLDLLRDNLPRTIVNLVVSPNVGEILPNLKVPLFCWLTNRFECPCVLGSKFQNIQSLYRKKINESLQVEIQVGNMDRYIKDDFAVIVQPFLLELSLPETQDGRTDLSYFSTDCFHLSQKAHARGANALWNNIMEPVGAKSTDWPKKFIQLKCPTGEYPYIFTRGNGPVQPT